MRRLKYPRKFLLLGLIVLVPQILVFNQYLNKANEDIAFSSKEQLGLVYLEPVNELLRLFHHYFVLAPNVALIDDPVVTEAFTTLGRDITKAIAAGAYPVRAVEVMDSVASEAEMAIRWNKGLDWIRECGEEPNLTHVLCASAVTIAETLKLDLIIVPTQTGYTAYNVSRYKPSVPIFACSTETSSVNALCLAWGVNSRLMPALNQHEVDRSESDAIVNDAIRSAKLHGFARPGHRAVVLSGLPLGQTRHTNSLRIVEIK